MYDLHTHLERLEAAIGDERDDPGDARRALRLVHEQVRAARLQAGSILAFGQERLDELESVGKGPLEAAEFDPLYGNERSQSGARSLLGQRLQLVQLLEETGASAHVCAPHWPSAAWYPLLLELSSEHVVLPPGSLERVAADAPPRLASWP